MIRVSARGRPPQEWAALCAQDPHATFFSGPRWMDALTRAYPAYRPGFLVAREGKAVAGVLPFVRLRKYGLSQILSLPFGTHGGPILAADAPPGTAPALARAFGRRVRLPSVLRYEMMVYDPTPARRAALAPVFGRVFQEFRTHVVDLTPGFEEIWTRRYDKNTRNCVRVAERAEVTAGEERGPEAVDILYRFHLEQSEGWPGIRPHPREALAAVAGSLGEGARIYVARVQGEPVAAVLFLENEEEVHPWVSGASEESRPVRAFHYLLNRALRDACDRGRLRWNFGASGGNPGIEKFKESFGARPVPLLRCFHAAGWLKRIRKGPKWD